MEEGLFPHSRSMLDPNQMEEERRLAYVGITRAKDQLFLTYTKSRLFFGTRSNNLPSRFISAIPETLIDLKVEYRDRHEEKESFDDDIYIDRENWE
jgi:DNA helicase-2/ATP-dependent DNA helicase PcrA